MDGNLLDRLKEAAEKATPYFDVVLEQGPGPESEFVECEDANGRGIGCGEWTDTGDGFARLRIPYPICSPDVVLALIAVARAAERVDGAWIHNKEIGAEIYRMRAALSALEKLGGDHAVR